VGLDVGNAHTAMSFKRIGSGGHSEYAAGQQAADQQPADQQPADQQPAAADASSGRDAPSGA